MQQAVPVGTGAMAAVLGMEIDAVRAVAEEAAQGEVCDIANDNAPGQIVISGHTAAVERAMALAKDRGAKRALPLPVSAPFHCDLMKPAAEKLAARLADISFSVPALPVINNVDVAVCDAPELIRDALVRQAYSPVRWIETVAAMASNGVGAVIECGPGKVLAGLTKRIARDVQGAAVVDAASLADAIALAGGEA